MRKQRPGYQEMKEYLRDGKADVVLAWHMDRVHRSPKEVEDFLDVAEPHDITVHTVKAGIVDLTTSAGRAMARTLCAWAKYESEIKAERVRRKFEQNAAEGRAGHGCVPYGWRRTDDYDDAGHRIGIREYLHEHEAAIVRECAGRVLRGESLR
jgi:DNA invertase Pin-like site-specific DNA recombinase